MATIETDRQSSPSLSTAVRRQAVTLVASAEAVQARVSAYSVLHTAREAVFDRLVFTTAQIFRVPVAAIAVVSETGFWLKAQVGLDIAELPRSAGLGAVLDHEDVLVVEDITIDARFSDSPFVIGPPRCRFLAGAPLVTPDGLRVGCLCVLDKSAKPLIAKQVWQLAQMARSVVGALEARLPSETGLE